MSHSNLSRQDRDDVACQLQRVENADGDHQPTEYLTLQQILLRLGLVAGTIGGVLALAAKIASGG